MLQVGYFKALHATSKCRRTNVCTEISVFSLHEIIMLQWHGFSPWNAALVTSDDLSFWKQQKIHQKSSCFKASIKDSPVLKVLLFRNPPPPEPGPAVVPAPRWAHSPPPLPLPMSVPSGVPSLAHHVRSPGSLCSRNIRSPLGPLASPLSSPPPPPLRQARPHLREKQWHHKYPVYNLNNISPMSR